ncbi:MAG: glycosyltransferase [Alphaproteobacteria bacterium]
MGDKSSGKRIMFYVQHLLGIGHMERALRLSRHLQNAGMAVTLVSGGMPYPHGDMQGAAIIQLAPVRAADAEFSQLLDDTGNPIDGPWRERRKMALLRAFSECAPDALLIEMFPFGRRQFGFELMPLLEAANLRKPAPLILCSVRDILVPSDKPGRTDEAIARARDYFDFVLVHGDARFMPLEASYPAALQLGEKLIYTGYVTADTAHAHSGLAGRNEVTISAGGGAVGAALMTAALQARALSKQAGHRVWRLLVGGNAPPGHLQALQNMAPDGVIVEPARPDFPQMLCNCACTVSQGGYNTVMDILQARAAAGTPAVIVPFAAAREQEQTLRAQALLQAGLAVVLPEMNLSPAALALAIDRAILLGNMSPRLPDMNGGVFTARFIQEKLND